MNADGPPAAPDVQGLVAAEVERQVTALRQEMDAKIAEVRARTVDDAATIVVFSGDLDKVLAAFVMATGAAAAGLETSMFFTLLGALGAAAARAPRAGRRASSRGCSRSCCPRAPAELAHLADELLRAGRA